MKKRVLVIEDEMIAAGRLISQIQKARPDYEILETLQSVEESVHWLSGHQNPDLIFMDIHLSDGLCFSIFSAVQVPAAIIFTTAYDQYALKAFKVKSIDYLLKPVDEVELARAIEKYESWTFSDRQIYSPDFVKELIEAVSNKKFRNRFLVKSGKALEYLTESEIAMFYSEDGLVFTRSMQNKRHVLDGSLEQLEAGLDPAKFFRINRKIIVHVQAIRTIHPHLNSRLKIISHTPSDFPLIVARERATAFKKWIDGHSHPT